MVEKSVEKIGAPEYLKKWITEANYEVLPTSKALSLIDVIPESNSISVTCRPTGIEETVHFVESVGKEKMKRVWPHLAARRIAGEEHFSNIVLRLLNAGMHKAFIVGGDGHPANFNFIKAEDILNGFSDRGIKLEKVRIGGYPEGNPVMDMDPVEVLLRKQDWAERTGHSMEIVTQMCFDVDTLISWIIEIRDRGVYLPVEVGVLGQIRWDSFIKVLGTLGVEDVVAFLRSKPKLAMSLATGIVTGFSPKDFLVELSEKNNPDLDISGISIFTLGNITNSVKCLTDIKCAM